MAHIGVPNGPAAIDSGRTLVRDSGAWATARFAAAVAQGRDFSSADLRTNEIMRNEEWKTFDDQLIEGFRERLQLVADLLGAGLVTTIPNGIAKTVLEYDLIGDMNEAAISMGGEARTDNDRLEFEQGALPLPIIHKDWYLNLRALRASQTGNTPLDTTYIRVVGRKIAEKIEYVTLNGGYQYQSKVIYGLLNHPNINTINYSATPWSNVATTGANVFTDIEAAITVLVDDGFLGPYWMYIGGTPANLKLIEDYKAATDGTIRARILETGYISRIGTTTLMPDDVVLIFQPTADVVKLISGEPLQNVQWDAHGGFVINFKSWQILIPLVRADADGNSGIVKIVEP
jgi:uncharacterized linocin/CFP29 family protein